MRLIFLLTLFALITIKGKSAPTKEATTHKLIQDNKAGPDLEQQLQEEDTVNNALNSRSSKSEKQNENENVADDNAVSQDIKEVLKYFFIKLKKHPEIVQDMIERESEKLLNSPLASNSDEVETGSTSQSVKTEDVPRPFERPSPQLQQIPKRVEKKGGFFPKFSFEPVEGEENKYELHTLVTDQDDLNSVQEKIPDAEIQSHDISNVIPSVHLTPSNERETDLKTDLPKGNSEDEIYSKQNFNDKKTKGNNRDLKSEQASKEKEYLESESTEDSQENTDISEKISDMDPRSGTTSENGTDNKPEYYYYYYDDMEVPDNNFIDKVDTVVEDSDRNDDDDDNDDDSSNNDADNGKNDDDDDDDDDDDGVGYGDESNIDDNDDKNGDDDDDDDEDGANSEDKSDESSDANDDEDNDDSYDVTSNKKLTVIESAVFPPENKQDKPRIFTQEKTFDDEKDLLSLTDKGHTDNKRPVRNYAM